MGYRLTKIYTRTGDTGTTGLADGSRVPKNHIRIQLCGELDELNCHMSALCQQPWPEELHKRLSKVQHDLFDLGGELSYPEHIRITEQDVAWLEQQIDQDNAHLPPLKNFILPGGAPGAIAAHLARSVCRRVERQMPVLIEKHPEHQQGMIYLNRLSDWLFVIARLANQYAGVEEVLWMRKEER